MESGRHVGMLAMRSVRWLLFLLDKMLTMQTLKGFAAEPSGSRVNPTVSHAETFSDIFVNSIF